MKKQSAGVQADHKQQRRQPSPVVENKDALVEALPEGLPMPDASLASQVTALKRLSSTQRQQMVTRMGRVQGNQHVQHVISTLHRKPSPKPSATIQPKLTVSEPGDEYEEEADRVAESVLRMVNPPAPPPGDEDTNALPRLARAGQPNDLAGKDVSPDVESKVKQVSHGSGNPLPGDVRERFEQRIGADFSGVRVHTDSHAAQTAQDLGARAYTTGHNVAFNKGEYAPGTTKGDRLLAHELTHVVQQGGAEVLERETPEDEAVQMKSTRAPGARVFRKLSLEDAVRQAQEEVSAADVDAEQEAPIEGQAPDLGAVPNEAAASDNGGGGGNGGGSAASAAEETDQTETAATEEASAPPQQQAASQSEAPEVEEQAPPPLPSRKPPSPKALKSMPSAELKAGGNGKAGPGASMSAMTGLATQAAAGGNGGAPSAQSDKAEPQGAQPPTSAAASAPPQAAQSTSAGGNGGPPPSQTAEASEPSSQPTQPATGAPPQAQATGQTQAGGNGGGPQPPAAAASSKPPQAAQSTGAGGNGGGPQSQAQATAAPAQATQRGGAAPAAGAAAGGDRAPASPEEDPAFQAVAGRSEGVAEHEQTHEPAANEAAESQAAADPQGSDVTMAAQDRQVGEMQQEEPKAFNPSDFMDKLLQKIEQATPQNLKEAEDFDGAKLNEAKSAVTSQVAEEKQEAEGPVEEKVEESPDESGIEGKQVEALPPAEAGQQAGAIGAEEAAPKSKGQSEVEAPVREESQSLDDQMAEADITEEQLQKSNEPEFQGALDAKNEAQTHAEEAPQQYRASEQSTLESAQGEAASTAQEQTGAMHSERAKLLQEVFGMQGETKTEDEGKRQEVANHIADIYETTKTEVQKIFDDLDGWVETEFETGANEARDAFVSTAKRRVRNFKLKRYLLQPGGALLWVKDQFNPPPPEIEAIFAEERQNYINRVTGLLQRIANHVAAQLNAAKARIAQGRQEIQEYVAELDPSLQDIGKQAAQQIQGKFDELEQSVYDKQEELVNTLADQYNAKLQEVDAELEKMREANKGLALKAKDALAGVIETILELKDMLMNMLSRAANAVEMIIKDPIKFLGNLIEGISMGLLQFVSNIGQHLKNALMSWLTGALGPAGITLPAKFDIKGIFSLVLQVLGLTWENIRAQIVQALGPKGEQIMQALETVWDVFQIIRKEGLAGLWAYIKDKIGDLKAMVLDAIKDMVITQVIKAGIDWLISILGGPAGAFIKAVQGIVRVVKWFINNAGRIMSLVNAIIDSITQIASGNLSAAANFVESALSQALPTVIGFLADLLGLGGIAKKVQDIIAKIRAPINKGIQWLVKQAKAMVKKVGKLLGFGKDEEDTENSKQVKNKAKQLITAQQPFESDDKLHSAVKQVEGKLKPEGLRSLVAKPKEEPGKYDLMAVASPAENISDVEVDDGSLEKARSEFGDTFFTGDELVQLLGDGLLARKCLEDGLEGGKLFAFKKRRRDPPDQPDLYSFSNARVNAEKSRTNRRYYYGYINPQKETFQGLAILSKGLINQPPPGMSIFDPEFHKKHARYRGARSGREFGWDEAILGHNDNVEGASDNWNSEGHKRTKEENKAWNQDTSRYWGPEHITESARSGSRAAYYRVPARAIGSHPIWWQ